MGLDITACAGAELTAYSMEDYGNMDLPADGIFNAVYAHPDFPDRADGLQEGVYQCTAEYDFRAGSYGGYNQWREWLSRQVLNVDPPTVWANPAAYEEAPFYPLIHMSDCDGIIGPRTSALLAQDFARYQDRIQGSDWAMQRYTQWRRAFELAANTGFVRFH